MTDGLTIFDNAPAAEPTPPSVAPPPAPPEGAAEDSLHYISHAFAASGFFPDARRQSQAIVKILAGRELGFGPMASMMNVFIQNGKVTLGANLQAALVKRHPHYDYRVLEHTAEVCSIQFLQDGELLGVSAFTLEDARKAGLAGKAGPWQSYPRNMLFARALSNGVKWYCPDVTSGVTVYDPDELEVVPPAARQAPEDGGPAF